MIMVNLKKIQSSSFLKSFNCWFCIESFHHLFHDVFHCFMFNGTSWRRFSCFLRRTFSKSKYMINLDIFCKLGEYHCNMWWDFLFLLILFLYFLLFVVVTVEKDTFLDLPFLSLADERKTLCSDLKEDKPSVIPSFLI